MKKLYFFKNHSMKIVFGLLFVMIAGLVVSSFGAKAADDKVKIGSLMCMSGKLAVYGPPVDRGIRLAAKHFNEIGGILGKDVEIVTRDTKTDPTSGVDAAKKLVKVDGVSAIVGAMSSGVSMSVAESVSIPNEVVQISPASTTPELPRLDDNDYVFRTVVTDAIQGVILGQLAVDLGYESLSVIYINNDYGKGLADTTSSWFEEQGGKVFAKVPYEGGKASYRGELEEATKQDPDVLVLIGYKENGEIILRQSISGGYIDEFLFPDGMKAPALIENIGAEFLNGIYGTVAGSQGNPSSAAFDESYAEEYGSPPPQPYMDTAYDAAVVLGLAMQKAGSAEPEAIRDNIRFVANPPGEEVYAGSEGLNKAFQLLSEGKDINYEGASGRVNFNHAGDVESPVEIWKIEDGKIVTVRYEETMRKGDRYIPATADAEKE